MITQYEQPVVAPGWAESRETHPAVAMAIHAIAGSKRCPEDIWAAPTWAEWEQVGMAVDNYVEAGVFTAEPDGHYRWGDEIIVLGVQS